VTAFLKFKEE